MTWNFALQSIDQVINHGAKQLYMSAGEINVPIVIVTLGSRGCFISQPDVYARVQAHVVDPVDTTGAGDAFVGGFAAGLVKFNNNIFEAAHFANAVAALAVTATSCALTIRAPCTIAQVAVASDPSTRSSTSTGAPSIGLSSCKDGNSVKRIFLFSSSSSSYHSYHFA